MVRLISRVRLREGMYYIMEKDVAYTIWLFNIAMEHGPFIDDFPSYKPPFIVDFPWLC